ncbi:hypothetical protein ACH40F_56845 [Streptomyces sp. NPDC020794]|uniref:hypothetical protein n=1 Tax=Streptomyces sp. NPDC020794 TaxID=3365090 RepID=UPI0037B785D6
MATHAPLLIALDGAGDQGRIDALLRLDRKKTARGTFKLPDGPPVPPRRAVRREDVLAIVQTDPARDIAAALPTATENPFALHMSTWARKDPLVKVQGPTGSSSHPGSQSPHTHPSR